MPIITNNGKLIPDGAPEAYTYNASNQIETCTYTANSETYVQTYTYTAGGFIEAVSIPAVA